MVAVGRSRERRYDCQNWRADVSAILTDEGSMVEWVKYSAYGVPFGLPAGDTDSDGDYDGDDKGRIGSGAYDVRKDVNLDGVADSDDISQANAVTGGNHALGRGVLSAGGPGGAVGNRRGYAGYEYAPELEGTGAAGRHLYHVRHRVYDAGVGRWTRRDPLGYVDGMGLYEYVKSNALIYTDPTGTDTARFHCRDVIGTLGNFSHCWVECCDNNGRCNNYGMYDGLSDGTMGGHACRIANDPRDTPAAPGFGTTTIVAGNDICKCMSEVFTRERGCRHEYRPSRCNSNWFASSMWRCCTGTKATPPAVPAPNINSCCNMADVPSFSCKRPGGGRYPGQGGGFVYNCGEASQ